MDKRILDKLIQSYHLKGMVESVIWDTKPGEITIKFINQTKDCAGEVKLENATVNLGEYELAFYSTSQLDNLLKVIWILLLMRNLFKNLTKHIQL